MDQELINEILSQPEHAHLPATLVHEVLDAVSAALGKEKLLAGGKRRQLKTEIARAISKYADKE